MPHKNEAQTIELFSLVNEKNGISKSVVIIFSTAGKVRIKQPSVSNGMSNAGAMSAPKRIEREKTILSILIKKIKTKRIIHRRFPLGISPKMIPHENAQAIAPESLFVVSAFRICIKSLNIVIFYHYSSQSANQDCEVLGINSVSYEPSRIYTNKS